MTADVEVDGDEWLLFTGWHTDSRFKVRTQFEIKGGVAGMNPTVAAIN